MNKWERIKAHYAEHHDEIIAAPRNEWAIDAYAWDEAGLFHLTPIEEWLWSDMRAATAVFYPQYPVGGVFVDFANPVAKVAIECDGKAFHLDVDKDAARDAKLRKLGWRVYRITGSQCRTDFDEQKMERGAARKFIDDICRRHEVSANPVRVQEPQLTREEE